MGKGCYYDTHRLMHAEQKLILEFPDWEWAELDRKRLVWVEKGMLYTSRLSSRGPANVKPHHDFNAMTFEAIQAPN